MFYVPCCIGTSGWEDTSSFLPSHKDVATLLFCGHLPAKGQTSEAASQPRVATLPDTSLAEKNFTPSLLAPDHAVQHERPLSDNWLPHHGVLGWRARERQWIKQMSD